MAFNAKLLAKIILLVGICLLHHPYHVSTFNIDTVNYIRHEGESNSMFGFSVALHQEQQRKWVIIGAPRYDTSASTGVVKGGAVFRCDISDDNRCQLIPFDMSGDQYNERNEKIGSKANQWFGATVTSAGVDGPLMACAPRYLFHTFSPKKTEKNDPVGTCYLAKDNFRTYTEVSPCRTNQWGYHRQGSCQAGFSAAISKNGDRVYIGAPGSYYWQGQVYSYNAQNTNDKVFSTKESPPTEDDSYLGYSSTTGDFDGDGQQDVAIGMPRGAELLGKIVVLNWNMTNIRNITGEQIGAYFGYSLAAVDVDGDRLDDLVVGAPMYTEPNNEGKYEVGRVYVLYQGRDRSFQRKEHRDGVQTRSRFGISVASLGDINLDGYGDFAVGAPYDGKLGRGIVYIYHGSKDGVRQKPSQIIDVEDFPEANYFKTFGFSISGGIDLDGNQYPDLVVGAYEANRAVVFKSRPVVVVEGKTQFTVDNKMISLEDTNCRIPGTDRRVVCTQVNSCLKYHGTNVPAELDLNVSWLLDAKKARNPRIYFLDYQNKNVLNNTIRLFRGKMECRTEKVFITDNVRDKLTPLEVEMKYYLPDRYQASRRTPRAVMEPVLDLNVGTVQTDAINIQKNCGPDNVCIPDLRLEVNTVDKYLLGSQSLLIIEVDITNHGEDAFEAGFFMNVPPALSFKSVKPIESKRDFPVTCTAPSLQNNMTLKCDIGNPLPRNGEVRFNVILNPARAITQSPNYDLVMLVNSTNPELEQNDFNNIVMKTIAISIETNLTIFGTSTPDTKIIFNATDYLPPTNCTTEDELGPQTVHIYNIQNSGPSRIEEAEIHILWPYVTQDNKLFLYLLQQPETSGNIRCERAPFVNEYNLQLNQTLSRISYLQKAGVYHLEQREGSAYSAIRQQQSKYGANNRTTSSSSSSSSSAGSSTRFGEGSSGDASLVHKQRQDAAILQQGGLNFGSAANKNNEFTFSTITLPPLEATATGPRLYSESEYGGSRQGAGTGYSSSGTSSQRAGGNRVQSGSFGSRSYGSGGSQYSSGGRRQSGSSSSYDSGRPFDPDLDGAVFESRGANSGGYSGGSRQSSYSSSGRGSSAGNNLNYIQNEDKNPDYDPSKLTHYHSFTKRDITTQELLKEAPLCDTFKCAVFKCIVGPLENNDDAYVALRTRLAIDTLTQITDAPANFSTMAVGRVTRLPYIGTPKYEAMKKFEIISEAGPVPVPKEEVVPLWIYILSALAGILLLLLLILLLWKCGFFKRNRPNRQSPETTPLKKAAYGHNDEHL